MPAAELFTYADALAAMDDFTQGHTVGHPTSGLRRILLTAYREITSLHDWSSLLVSGRVHLVAPQTTGTVAFDLTGGATCERQLTLTGATYPASAADYSIRFADLLCDIERRYSDTVVSLDPIMSPGADVSSATYSLWPRYYQLPYDFLSMARTQKEGTDWILGQYVSPEDMHELTHNETTSGNVRYYTIGAAPDIHGMMALYVHPPADTTEGLDFLYKRSLRPLRYSGKDTNDKAGTITLTQGSATVMGSSTAFSSNHIGAILRTTGNGDLPTGLEGENPWVEQRSIIAVASTTSLTLDAAASASYSGKRYSISDPIDLMPPMYDAFIWLAKKHLAVERQFKDLPYIDRMYQQMLALAKGADSRTRHKRIAGVAVPRYQRLRDYAVNREEVT